MAQNVVNVFEYYLDITSSGNDRLNQCFNIIAIGLTY